MNSSCAWFEKNYAKAKVKNILIHPSNKVDKAAAFTHNVEIMSNSPLFNLLKSIRAFFKAFEAMDFNDLSSSHIQKLVDIHKLSVTDFLTEYTKKPLVTKRPDH